MHIDNQLAKHCINLGTRHRFISSVGDDQEKYYEQKYGLTVPITPQSQAILEPPQSPSPHSPRQYWSLLSPHHPTVPGNTGASSVPITPQSQAILEPPQSPSSHSPRQYWSLLSPHHPTVPGNTGASSVPITPQSQAILEPPQSPSPHSPRQYWSLLNPHHPTVPGNTGASSVPITPQSQAILEPPQSWVEFCAKQGMCDEHVDAMSCMQSAVSRGFHTDALRELARVYMEHCFLTEDEADVFLTEIPVLGEREEPETIVSSVSYRRGGGGGDIPPQTSDLPPQEFLK